MTGRVHAVQSLGAVDGPGLRYVIFLAGCPLRCIYCHNPDTWRPEAGTEMDVNALARQVIRCKPYFRNGGGVTVSGGEPLLQASFVAELFRILRAHGIHTALDTAGMASEPDARLVLQYTDLVLADLKFTTDADYLRYTGGLLPAALRFLDLTAEQNIPLWVRHVIVPGINDTPEDLRAVHALASRYSNLEKIEWLPFHNLCREKYDALGIPFPLADTGPLSRQRLDLLLRESGLS